MGQSKKSNDAVPDDKPANGQNLRRVDEGETDAASFAAPDLGGSFETNDQVRRSESGKAAAKTDANSSAGS